jgi:hypothetical protein
MSIWTLVAHQQGQYPESRKAGHENGPFERAGFKNPYFYSLKRTFEQKIQTSLKLYNSSVSEFDPVCGCKDANWEKVR